jgi:rubrerythrin
LFCKCREGVNPLPQKKRNGNIMAEDMKSGRERSLKMLDTALTMEKKGISFYEKALSTCKNDVGREIYKMLKDDESVHIERIMKIFSSLEEGSEWKEEWSSMKLSHGDLNEMFIDLAKKHSKNITVDDTDIEALNVGIDFELKSVDFYKQHLEEAEDSEEREFLKLMIGEEKSHYNLLEDMRYYLTDPESWFMEKERGGLDGA